MGGWVGAGEGQCISPEKLTINFPSMIEKSAQYTPYTLTIKFRGKNKQKKISSLEACVNQAVAM